MTPISLIAATLLALAPPPPPPPPAPASTFPGGIGEEIYMKRCAECHGAIADEEAFKRSGPSRIPPRFLLEKMPKEHIVEALKYGAMTEMAIGLTDADFEAIAAYLTKGKAGSGSAPPR